MYESKMSNWGDMSSIATQRAPGFVHIPCPSHEVPAWLFSNIRLQTSVSAQLVCNLYVPSALTNTFNVIQKVGNPHKFKTLSILG